MPYRVRKSKCRRSDGKRGSWVLAYKDKSGKSHSNCHTSKSGAEAQIAAIEGPKESRTYQGDVMKLTTTMLRRIIAEEVAAVTQAPGDSTRGVESLMTPEEEITLARAAKKKPAGSFEEAEAGYRSRLEDRRWAELSRKFPKTTRRVGRGAFDREWTRREEGAAGGGGYLTYADEFRILLDLLEKS